MTKKHFIAFAEQIKKNRQSLFTHKSIEETNYIIDCEIHLICTVAKQFCANFDEGRFIRACGEKLS